MGGGQSRTLGEVVQALLRSGVWVTWHPGRRGLRWRLARSLWGARERAFCKIASIAVGGNEMVVGQEGFERRTHCDEADL